MLFGQCSQWLARRIWRLTRGDLLWFRGLPRDGRQKVTTAVLPTSVGGMEASIRCVQRGPAAPMNILDSKYPRWSSENLPW